MHGFLKVCFEVLVFPGLDGVLAFAVHAARGRVLAQHHARVFQEVAVHVSLHGVGERLAEAFVATLHLHLASLHPAGVAWWIARGPLPHEHDVGHHFSVGEGALGEPDGPYQVGLLRQSLPHRLGGRGVQGVVRSDEGEDATRTELVQGLGEEVVVDLPGQERPPLAEGGVGHGIVAEGDVRDGQVDGVVGDGRLLEAHDVDIGVWVEMPEHVAGGGVQLHRGPLRAFG